MISSCAGWSSAWVLILLLRLPATNGRATCNTDAPQECEQRYGPGSMCREDNRCSVPELEKGCLQSMIPEWTQKRVCNSEDPPNAAANGLCEEPELPYTEMRLYGANWESRTIQSWLVQIILSELLGVPVTVEGGSPEATINFYDSSKPLNYGTYTFLDNNRAYQRANTLQDCTRASRDPENYVPCAHATLEVWNGESAEVRESFSSGVFEASTFSGMMGDEGIFMTKFTLENDPSLASYLGLEGEENRQKLAETFLRPTTWKDYCDLVSTNNCTSDDGVAKRYPQGSAEEDRMFVEGTYIGHFGATEENDCSLNNETFQCTGHVADGDCHWSTYVEPQMNHLGIALQSSGNQPNSRGYTYQQQVDMWYAANATKSNLIMYWWTPEPLYHRFEQTDAEMIQVIFPVTTQECIDNRVNGHDSCKESKDDRIGSPLGVCQSPAIPLLKVLVSSLQDISNKPNDPEAMHSPAYEMIRLFQFTEYQLSEITKYQETEPSSRQAVCRWASENMDYLQSFVPRGYPRNIEPDEQNVFGYITTTVAACVALLVLVTLWTVHKEREEEAIKLAQIGFLQLLLAGSLLICIGAILIGVMPSKFTCTASIWFVNVGYTLELVPLIVKVAAICRIMEAAQKLQRVKVSRQRLYGVVGVVLFLILVYLAVWTGLDPPKKQVEYSLMSEEGENETVIQTSYYCSSESHIWAYAAVGWNVVLLFIASVWAFQMRSTHAKLNETATLAFLIYSHFVFVVLRVVTFMLSGHVQEKVLQESRSLIYSLDTLVTILIYFVPKFTASKEIKKNIGELPITKQLSKLRSRRFLSRRKFDSHATQETIPETEAKRATVASPEMMDIQEVDSEMEDSDSRSRDGGMEDYAFVKVDKVEMVATKDRLISMEKIDDDADAEHVVEEMMGIIKELHLSFMDDTKLGASECVQADAAELVGLVDNPVQMHNVLEHSRNLDAALREETDVRSSLGDGHAETKLEGSHEIESGLP